MSTTRRTALVLLACGSYVASQGNLVRIDDSSVYSPSNPTGIQYSQTGWSTVTSGGAAQRYQGTYTQSQAYGSQAWFAFQGSSITYYADQPPGFGSVAISLDGANNVNVNWTNAGTTTLYQQNIWSAVGLSTGDHTVVLGNTNINNDTIGLDYFAVTAWNGDDIKPQNFGPGATSVPAAAVLVDNESDQMSYSGGSWKRWYTTASINSTIQAMYFNRTMHCATTPGAVATFRFNGTALWYFSEDYSADSRIQLSIDGGAGDNVDTATTGHAWTSQKLFWHVSDLSPEVHTFTITHAGANEDYACVDFLMYLPSSASPNTPTPSPTPTPLPASSKSTPVGAIAGGAAGGVALVVLLIILAVVFFKRRSRQPKNGIQHETYAGDAAYHTKPADPMYTTNNLGHGPVYGQLPSSPYSHVGDRSSVAQSAWTGATYQGHPEVQ